MITCGNGLLAQINKDYHEYTISKEELLVWAKEFDEQFKKEYPYCAEQNLITRILKECFEDDTKEIF